MDSASIFLFIRRPWLNELSEVQATLDDYVGDVVADGCEDAMSWNHVQHFSVCCGGRVLSPKLTLRAAGVQSQAVLSINGSLLGGTLAMEIALRRTNEARTKAAKKSPYVSKVGKILEQESEEKRQQEKLKPAKPKELEERGPPLKPRCAAAVAVLVQEEEGGGGGGGIATSFEALQPGSERRRSSSSGDEEEGGGCISHGKSLSPSSSIPLSASPTLNMLRRVEKRSTPTGGGLGGLRLLATPCAEWARYYYLLLAWELHRHVASQPWFEAFVMANILAVAVTTGLALNEGGEADNGWVAAITFWVFIAEAALKIVSCGPKPQAYFTASKGEGVFNCFDFALVVVSVALRGRSGVGAIKTLRLARLARLLRAIKNVPELKVIVEGLVAGLQSVGYIVLLLVLVIYLFAVLGVMTFAGNDPASFGDVPIAMLTLFESATLSSWSAVAWTQWHGRRKYAKSLYRDDHDEDGQGDDEGQDVHKELATVATLTGRLYVWDSVPGSEGGGSPHSAGFAFVYFTLFIIVTAMVIMSLFIGVITMAMKRARRAEQYEAGLSAAIDAGHNMLAAGSEVARAVDAAMARVPHRGRRSISLRRSLRRRAKRAAIITAAAASTAAATPPATTVSATAALFVSSASERVWLALGLHFVCEKAAVVVKHPLFQALITSSIVVAGVVIGLSTDKKGSPKALRTTDQFCLVVFTAEVGIKVAALEFSPVRYFEDSWNIFDFLIVVNGWLEMLGVSFQGLAALRLLRLLRVFRLAKALPRLRSIVESLISGLSSVGWIMVLMGLFNYITACVGVLLFQELDPFHFGTLLRALFTTYRVETLDGWGKVCKISMYGCAHYPGAYPLVRPAHDSQLACNPSLQGLGWVAALYFVFVVVFGGLILPTALIGIVAISFEESYRKAERERKNAKETKLLLGHVVRDMPHFFTPLRLELLHTVFRSMDVDDGGTLDLNEVTPLLAYISSKHLRVELSVDELHDLVLYFDEDNTSDLNFGELVTVVRYIIKARDLGKLRHATAPQAIMTQAEGGGGGRGEGGDDDEFSLTHSLSSFNFSPRREQETESLAISKTATGKPGALLSSSSSKPTSFKFLSGSYGRRKSSARVAPEHVNDDDDDDEDGAGHIRVPSSRLSSPSRERRASFAQGDNSADAYADEDDDADYDPAALVLAAARSLVSTAHLPEHSPRPVSEAEARRTIAILEDEVSRLSVATTAVAEINRAEQREEESDDDDDSDYPPTRDGFLSPNVGLYSAGVQEGTACKVGLSPNAHLLLSLPNSRHFSASPQAYRIPENAQAAGRKEGGT